ncbi:MAG: glutamine-hydrolyzing carbamoyl-phosphate synthase small subunit [Chloroflexi bacterium]|nr:glutamine-hydrolyzing carbamoyl-phosphate synthase small subunit [Chloroflexota bacterium]
MTMLALEDGTIWQGDSFGAETETVGEVVFNTALSGYQEVLTDPSYHGQMVVMTVTQVGNTGINEEDLESRRPYVAAFIVRELSTIASNWRSSDVLHTYLRRYDVPGLSGVNTRALTLHLRTHGSLRGALSTRQDSSPKALVEMARAWSGLEGRDLVRDVTRTEIVHWEESSRAEWGLPVVRDEGIQPRIAVYDYGVKQNILRRLRALGCDVYVIPAAMPLQEVEQIHPDGYLLSNGPGDPDAVPYGIRTARQLIDLGRPTLGICLGHQMIGLALAGKTYKLKFGHHGSNQPVKNLLEGRVRITSQNHNYAVAPESLPSFVTVTERNLNDDTVEGLRVTDCPIWSVQYHPEASPGPHDADDILRDFVAQVRVQAEQRAVKSS